MTEAEIKTKLLSDEDKDGESELPSATQITAATMLIAMFDLEEQQ